jgi:FkbM family methyltransferase
MLRRIFRRAVPPSAKRAVANLVAGSFAGACIRSFNRHTIKHRNSLIRIDHPRVSNRMVGQLFWRIYERAELDQIAHFLPRDADVLEVGGSSGITTLLIASLLSKERTIISVEADPELSALALENCGLNGYSDRATFISAAVDYEHEHVIFRRDAQSVVGKIENSGLSGNSITVPTVTLSHLANQYNLRDYTLVMDIEGAELEVLRHGDLRGAKRILAELHEIRTAERNLSVPELVHEFEKAGFQIVNRDAHCVVLDRV